MGSDAPVNDLDTTISFYVRNNAFIINNILCGNWDFLWANIRPALDDNKNVLAENEAGLRPPLDEITIRRLQSRLYGELDDALKQRIVSTAWRDIHNILGAMVPAQSALRLYRTITLADDVPRPHIRTLAAANVGDIIRFPNISSSSGAPGWSEDSGKPFYRLVISIPKGGLILELDQFECHNEDGEILLPPMKCNVICKTTDANKKCRGVLELEFAEYLRVDESAP